MIGKIESLIPKRLKSYPPKLIYAILTLSFLTIFCLILFTVVQIKKTDNFKIYITKCNSAPIELRFSCYRSGIDKYFKTDPSKFVQRINTGDGLEFKDQEASYAVFGTNCHTFYHAAGDFIADNVLSNNLPSTDTRSKINYCPKDCTGGCIMGLFKRLALANKYDESLLSDFYTSCREDEKVQCSHEIGHLLNDKYNYSVLKVIDEISLKNYGLKQSRDYVYATFPKPDMNQPFRDCEKIIKNIKDMNQCYTGIGHNLFLFSSFIKKDNYKSFIEDCKNIGTDDKDKCLSFLMFRIGINDGGPKLLSGNSEQANNVCRELIKQIGNSDLAIHCYTGIGAGIGLFIDSEYHTVDFSKPVSDKLKADLLNYGKLCKKVDHDYINNCYAGLFGTKFKKLYYSLDLFDPVIDKLIPSFDVDYQVVL